MGLLERKDWIPYVYRAAGGSAYCFAKTSVSPTVVEWGGGDDALLVPMMEAVAARHGPFLVLRQPWQTPPLYPVMVDSGMDISVRMLGMLKILNPEVLGAYCTNSAKTPDGMLDDLGDLPSASCEEQRRFIRKYFGDPFGQYTPSSMVIWDWEEVSYV